MSIKLSGEEFAHKNSCVQAQRSQSDKARGKDVPDSLLIWQVSRSITLGIKDRDYICLTEKPQSEERMLAHQIL